VLLAAFLLAKQGCADEWARERIPNDIYDSDRGFSGYSYSDDRWNFFLSGGVSYAQGVNSAMQTDPANLTFFYRNVNWFLNFPGQSVTVDHLDNGYAVEAAINRQLVSWFSLGLQGGLSFEHKQNVGTGLIPFTMFGPGGVIISQSIETYTLQYKVWMSHIAPVATLGPWIPAGICAVRPYVSGGAGYTQVQEAVNMSLIGTDFPLGQRNTDYLGVLGGAGLDVRILKSGGFGANYQFYRASANGQTWKWSTATLRFSYIF
jgi:hypothetical protein